MPTTNIAASKTPMYMSVDCMSYTSIAAAAPDA